MKGLKSGGPEQCPKPCGVCEGVGHHWIDVCPNPDDVNDQNLQHEAFKTHGLLAWYGCKHCDAWAEDVEEEQFLDAQPAPAKAP